jgi:hypothetical protein
MVTDRLLRNGGYPVRLWSFGWRNCFDSTESLTPDGVRSPERQIFDFDRSKTFPSTED